MKPLRRKVTYVEALANETGKGLAREVGVTPMTVYYQKKILERDGNLDTPALKVMRAMAIKHDLDLWYLIFNEDRPTYEEYMAEVNGEETEEDEYFYEESEDGVEEVDPQERRIRQLEGRVGNLQAEVAALNRNAG